MDRRNFLMVGAAAAMAPVLAGPAAQAQATHQTGEAWFTNVALQTHEGRTVRFYDDLLKGKVAVINFMFTTCSDVCPSTTQNLVYVQDLLDERVGRDVFMYSITIDPDTDTPQRLAEYVVPYGIKPGWLFLTGQRRDTELLRQRLGFVDSNPAQDADPEQHIGTLRIGNEPLHRWIMANSLVEPESIVRSIERMFPA